MPVSKIFTDFSAGYWSRKLDGRLDSPSYEKACSDLKNMVPTPQGGAMFRPGMRHLADLGVPAAGVIRLIPLAVGEGEEYAVILTHGKVEVWNALTGVKLSEKTTSDPGYEGLYSSAEIPLVRWEQVGYTIIMTCPGKDPYYLYIEKDGVA